MRPSRVAVGCVLCFALLLSLAPASAADAVRVGVLADEGRRLVLEFELLDHRLEPVVIDGREYVVPVIPGEAVALEAGAPALPLVARSVIIPGGAQWQAKVLDSSFREITAAVAPSKGNLSRRVDPATVPYRFGEAYGRAGFYPGVEALVQPPYVLRDFTGLTVHFLPFQYDPARQTLRVVERMTVELTPAAPIPVTAGEHGASGRTPVRAFEPLYRAHFLNYGAHAARYPALDEEGEILVIAHDEWIPNLDPLVGHKADLGFTISVVGVSTIGNNATAIKNYVQSVYDSRNLAFVLLVGDAAQVATTIRAVGGENGACDACYGKLAGTDGYPDVMVGRFSAGTAAEVDTQVERTIDYETQPATTQAWFKRAVGIASAEGDGIGDEGQSDRQHQDQIRNWLLGDGYTLVDRIYDPGATDAQVSGALNAGRGLVNYVGHGSATSWGTTGFNNDDVNALANDGTLPFVFSVACNNGEFHHFAACFGEAWLRAQQAGQPTGAVAAYMSSVSQSWAPPMEAQDEFNLLLTDPTRPYASFGTLAFAASASMIDAYGSGGVEMSDTWIVFGDPSVQIVGVPQPVHGLKVTPPEGLHASGDVGGPFAPASRSFTLENLDPTPIDYQVTAEAPWIVISTGRGTLASGQSAGVLVSLGPEAGNLDIGTHSAVVNFTNLSDHAGDTTRWVTLKVSGEVGASAWTLDTNPGWSTQGEWQFGPPQGKGGGMTGNPDPSSAATGTNVYGVNLAGNFSAQQGGPYYLTLGPVDLSGVSGGLLRFRRWLNVLGPPYVAATVDVSNNGTSWTNLWSASQQVSDDAWRTISLDISAVADGRPQVWIRWGYQVLRTIAVATSGWNVDDIEIWGQPSSAKIALSVATDRLDWSALSGVSAYDVVQGSTASLAATGGDFAVATQSCVANDLPAVTLPFTALPAAGDALWLLVRGGGAGSALTYGDLAPGQVAPRDPGIAASASACP
ncbi:MAG: C25 family cysteine peptidase [Acidobacteria bacterium]|nr:C25 family cysteine peptidase [Acidobacteriota bacterium]